MFHSQQNSVEVEKVEITKKLLLLQASNQELNAKVDSLNKTIEANKKTKKELQVRNNFRVYSRKPVGRKCE